MLKTEEQHAHCKRSCYDDVTPINSGPPALYRLNTKRKYIDGNQKKVRRWTYGQKDENKPNKVILLVGETGTGKTTMINTMVNYLLGVKFEDEEFYQITEEIKEENKDEEEDQTESQTSEVTVYEVFVKEKPTSLTIIDTPGYGHTTPGYEGYEKDREVSKYLMELFSDKDGVNHIDAVCFVMKASQNRLSGKEHYIFHSVLSLFGKDIEENIVFLLTQSPGGPPKNALSAIKKAEIPCRKDTEGKPIFFLFNNQQKETRDKEYEQNYKLSWEMGEKSMNGFFTLMDENNRKSVQMTLTVLKKQTQLEACTSSLMERIFEKELKMKELTEIQEAIKQNREKIEKCENFEFTVTKTLKEKVPIAWWCPSNATCCSVCQENCHSWSCWWANDPSECWVMKDDNCTVCTRKCHYSKHVKENKVYVMKTKDVINTFDDLKKEYEYTDGRNLKNFDKTIFENTKTEHERSMQESESKSRVEDELNRDLENIKKDKSKLVNDAYVNIKILCQTALKADSAFTLQHLDFLIPRLKEEGKDEWIKDLEELQKAGEKQKNKSALNHLMGMTRQKYNQFFQYVIGKNQEIQ